ncbi:hypothetical protein GCM10022223_47280 [Kineosporia mesophila]|uniref:Uncharacterized protein n=1 Tax=Kineosporia mesophila TaxID=566012 RepID=A0ABP7A4E4_9ACTN|nr:hypothetical protein [Kineosporia mesophila]MCD5353834.1 hypothetical protein [Kineosporia mesophila]
MRVRSNVTQPPGTRPHILDLEQLRFALNSVVDLAAARFGTTIDVDQVLEYNDYYWQLPTDIAYAMHADPGLYVNVGQISDDLEELAEMLDEPDEQVLWHSLEHLTGLLRLLAFLENPRPGRERPPGQVSPLPDITDPKPAHNPHVP